MVNSSSLLTSSNRETSPPTVCCYNSNSNSNILSNTFRSGGSSNQTFSNSNNNNNKNQNKSHLVRYNSVGTSSSRGTHEQSVRNNNNNNINKRNCDNLIKSSGSKIRVKSDPCLGGLSVNLVEINDNKGKNEVDDGQNHHKLLLSNTKSISGSSSSSYVIGKSNGGSSNCVSAIKNRTVAATVLCKQPLPTTTTTPPTDYSNNFCVNNNICSNNNKSKVNYSNKNRTKSELPLLLSSGNENSKNTRNTSEKLENLNLLNCFTTSKVSHPNKKRDSRSSSVCFDGTSENSLNTSVLSEDFSTDVSLSSSSSLRKLSNSNNNSESQKSSLTTNSSIKSDASSINKTKCVNKNGNLIHKLLTPAITPFKKSKDFPELNSQHTENKQIICANLNDHANNLNFIDCSSSGDISLSDDSHLIRPLPQNLSSSPHNSTPSPKRTFLHTIPTVSSPLLVDETTKLCNNSNNQPNIDFNNHQTSSTNQIKLKEFYEQKTLSNTTDLHKFKSNSNNTNQQHPHIRYKTIAGEYPNIASGWNPNENYPNNQVFYESVSNNNCARNDQIRLNHVPYLINTKVPATVPRNNNQNHTKNLKYYQTQGVNGVTTSGSTNQLTKSQQDIQKQVSSRAYFAFFDSTFKKQQHVDTKTRKSLCTR